MSEFEMLLHNLATNPERIKRYQVLCLPEGCPLENFENAKQTDKLCYTRDSEELCRLLKENGIKCANHDDLGIDALYGVRKAADYLYLCALWIRDSGIIPIIIQLVFGMCLKKKEEAREPKLQINIQNSNIFFEGGEVKIENFTGDLKMFKGDLTSLKRRIDKM